MERAHAELLARLESYSFRPAFVSRLMRENSWSRAYAERVCREYKRFLFLTRVAGHPCTPSDQVDQVWHLHLLYTEDYWLTLCPALLGRALHHRPSAGGAQETEKFRDRYACTLQSYRRWLGVQPAEDIWPGPACLLGPEQLLEQPEAQGKAGPLEFRGGRRRLWRRGLRRVRRLWRVRRRLSKVFRIQVLIASASPC